MFKCMTPSNKNLGRNCHLVFGFLTTMRHFTSHCSLQCGFLQPNHPTYNADLAPSDYYLFRDVKSRLRGTRFADDTSLKAFVEVV